MKALVLDEIAKLAVKDVLIPEPEEGSVSAIRLVPADSVHAFYIRF